MKKEKEEYAAASTEREWAFKDWKWSWTNGTQKDKKKAYDAYTKACEKAKEKFQALIASFRRKKSLHMV